MKRNRAILLFGSITVLSLGYVAWCSRSMYLSVPVPVIPGLPAEYQEDVKSIVIERGLTGPDPFNMPVFLRLLSQPYDSAPLPLVIHPSPPDLYILRRSRANQPYAVPVLLLGDSRGWRVSDYQIGSEKRPGRFLERK